jgi:transcriptional regulator with GAF, ATPase, and Fis domain
LRWTDADGPHSVALTGTVVAGSAPNAGLILRDPTVSRLHAELEARADGAWVHDLGSKNGTFVEGVLVKSARVPKKGRVAFGSLVLVVDYEATEEPEELWPEARFGSLVGGSAPMRRLFAYLSRIAPTESSVVIQGETGTGKEEVARTIHEHSARREGPFIVVDCAAIPENLFEAQLFGHARGAFTGAVGARVGDLEAAGKGTVFLDEVGELPLAMQPKLLRALESRTIRRLGETEARAIDVRFISATHRDLRKMVNAGAFREDLYFRLAVVPLTVPPLRERLGDIPALVRRFMPAGVSAEKSGALSPELERELRTRPWLGNVREL